MDEPPPHPRVLELQRIPVAHKQGDPEWFAKRFGMLTASLFASVLGNDPYNRRPSRYRELATADPLAAGKAGFNSGFMKHGTENEDIARQKYEEATGEKVVEFGCLSHAEANTDSDYGFLGGSPDGVTLSGRLIEIKCPASRPIVPGQVPKQYVDQIQGLLWTLDLEVCDFIEYKPHVAPEQFTIMEVRRDPTWQKTNVPILVQFWKDVESYRKREEECRRGAARTCARAVEAHFAAKEHLARMEWESQEWKRLAPKRRAKRSHPPPHQKTLDVPCLIDDCC